MRVEDPGPVDRQNPRITELFAWTAISKAHDTEGIVSFRTHNGNNLPAVSSVREIAEKFRPYAEEMARQSGAEVRLRRFVEADE